MIQSTTGDEFGGIVHLHEPSWDLAVSVKDLDDGVLRLSTWRAAGRTGVQIWLATWNASFTDRVKAFGGRADGLLERLLAD